MARSPATSTRHETAIPALDGGDRRSSAVSIASGPRTSAVGGVHDDVDVVEHGLPRAVATERPEADLQVRAGGDADDAGADAGDLLALHDLGPDRDQIGSGVAVVDGLARQRPGGDLQDRGVGPEPADALLDDGARTHGVEGRATGGRIVDALIDAAARQVRARQRQACAAAGGVGVGLWSTATSGLPRGANAPMAAARSS